MAARTLAGTWGATAAGRPEYSVYAAGPALVGYVMVELEDHGFLWVCGPVIGIESVVAEVRRQDELVCLGWDIWTGFYVFAADDRHDAATRYIAAWLEPRLRYLDHFVHANAQPR